MADEKLSLRERLSRAMLKPVEPDALSSKPSDKPLSVEELQEAVKTANDKERLIGLIAAPLAAAIGVLVLDALVRNATKLHQSTGVYNSLMLVLVGLSVLMMAFAWFRKRLYLGMVLALYGLTIFNL